MFSQMNAYRAMRVLGLGPHGPVEEVLPHRLGAEPCARRRLPVPVGPARARLRERAETLARLGHPGLATIIDVVDVDEETVELVRTVGEATLAERLVAGTVPGPQADRLAAALTDAVQAMHSVGVAHGRITASNVLLAGDHVLLADPDLATDSPDPARDLDDLAALLAELRHLAPPAPPPAAGSELPHWTAWRTPAPAPAGPTIALPERALAGALAFGLGLAMGVTFVLAETITAHLV
jgi:serine/threonine-protein kinase